ncbi:MAG: hypothetical protein ACXWAA_13985, partial [Methylobacter sp.]
AMETTDVAALNTANVANLRTSQIAALGTSQVAGLTTSQIDALTTSETVALTTSGIAALTTTQAAELQTAGVQALKTSQVAALTTSNLAVLSTSQIMAVTTSGIASLTTSQVAALGTSQVDALTTSQSTAFTTAGIAAMGTTDVAALNTANVANLRTSQIAALGTSQIANLTTSQIDALTTSQVSALTTTGIAALTTTQAAELQTADVHALRTAQVVALSTANIAALSTSQIEALGTRQVEALTSSQIAALSTTQISHLSLGTPIVLDLNGDGVKTTNISSGTQFDLFATGQKVNTGWVSSSDGLLVLDRNHDGKINDGSELFGSSTVLSNGEKASDGYAALSALDSNGDGSISKADAEWGDLKVWVDKNSDGINQSDETLTLDSLGISKLNLNAESSSTKDNGNLIGLISSYETVDGTSHDMADVWFVADKNQALPTQVSGLTQAIASYSDSQAGTTNTAGSSITAPLDGSQSQQGDQAVAVNVGGMVDTLKQFDNNGNLITNSVQTSSSLQAGVGGQSSLVDAQDPTKTGFLVSK